MAIRPFAFGVRLRDPARNRTLAVRRDAERSDRWLVEDDAPGGTVRASFDSAPSAVREVARLWRSRLN